MVNQRIHEIIIDIVNLFFKNKFTIMNDWRQCWLSHEAHTCPRWGTRNSCNFSAFFHLYTPGLSLEWAGVPLFFVKNGFLMTGILLEEKKEIFADDSEFFYIKRILLTFSLF